MQTEWTTDGGDDPRWVDAVLNWRWTWLMARVGLTSAYLINGIINLINFPALEARQMSAGLHPPGLWAIFVILVQIVGTVLLIVGRFVWLGAAALAALTAVIAFSTYDFWSMQGGERLSAANEFFEHIGIIAAFFMAALIAEHDARINRTD
jgi:uncharacterized membrane protein YphA (DoxX/SURF4 family)